MKEKGVANLRMFYRQELLMHVFGASGNEISEHEIWRKGIDLQDTVRGVKHISSQYFDSSHRNDTLDTLNET